MATMTFNKTEFEQNAQIVLDTIITQQVGRHTALGPTMERSNGRYFYTNFTGYSEIYRGTLAFQVRLYTEGTYMLAAFDSYENKDASAVIYDFTREGIESAVYEIQESLDNEL